MELLDAIKKRRSIRAYLKKEVPLHLIEELIHASSFAPVSCNLQLTQYVVINDDVINNELAEKVSYKFKYAPCNIVVLQDSRFLGERNSGVMSAGMAVENILLRATELGLSTCSMAGFNKDGEIRKILSIPNHMEILLIISLGYFDESTKILEIPKLNIKNRYNLNSYGTLSTIRQSLILSNYSVSDIINYRKRISPVYLDRFRLNTYSPSYYKEVLDFLCTNIYKQNSGEILDLISYDGVFLKTINENKLLSSYKITASDYIRHNLDFIADEFGYEVLEIDEKNFISSSKKFDFMTFIFQLNFTPSVDSLLLNCGRILKNDGLFIVAVVHQSWYRKIAIKLKNIYLKYILKKEINIYENNTYYKIGPIEQYSKSEVISLFNKNGLGLVRHHEIKKQKGVAIGIYIFKKINFS